MPSQEIARQNWTHELDMFSQEHDGWIVSVRVVDGEGREQTEVRTLPLHGVSVDDPQQTRVAITVGHNGQDHFTHEISKPVRIVVERLDARALGADEAVREHVLGVAPDAEHPVPVAELELEPAGGLAERAGGVGG